MYSKTTLNLIIKNLDRYSEGHVSEQLDPEFAAAVQQAILILEDINADAHD